METNTLGGLKGLVVTENGIQKRKRKKFLGYEEIRQIHQILDQKGAHRGLGEDLARRFDVSPQSMNRVIRAWKDLRGTAVNKGGVWPQRSSRSLWRSCRAVSASPR